MQYFVYALSKLPKLNARSKVQKVYWYKDKWFKRYGFKSLKLNAKNKVLKFKC